MAMTTLTQAMDTATNTAVTENGMEMLATTRSAVVDFFYAVGGARNRYSEQSKVNTLFAKARKEDLDLAVRVALYARDVRGGMGERAVFRSLLRRLAIEDRTAAARVMRLVPELGRWDDLFALMTTTLETDALEMYAQALRDRNALAAKWAPREKSAHKNWAVKLRRTLGVDARTYRKMLAELTNVVETQMTSGQWDDINYSHVPSVAAARYQRAFDKHSPERYGEYRAALESGEAGVKINAGAVYPYDVLKSIRSGDERVAEQQWLALKDWIPEGVNFLPIADVSGSMGVQVAGSTTAMDIAVSLGIYCAQRNTGAFRDRLMTFSANPNWLDLTGLNLAQSFETVLRADWGFNTNIEATYNLLLNTAKAMNVAQADMPDFLIVFSDMQFDQAQRGVNMVFANMRQAFELAGYEMPRLVFWNLAERDATIPVEFDQDGVALVSGFSPALLEPVLGADYSKYDPLNIVREVVCKERYDW
jgi:hypothetical protein